jgi:glutaminyl-tRNA synthetase
MTEHKAGSNFIRQIIDADLESGKHHEIVTRFPPEPNGYLHIGHAKSIWLNFGIAGDYHGRCTLRYDDTNPVREDAEFVEAIERDVRWLGFAIDQVAHASDYFPQLHEFALELIRSNLAYVDSLPAEKIRENRGTLTQPGRNSPDRDSSVERNLAEFNRMKNGEFKDGERVLRAKIDMASPNINMRDPVIYRIRHHDHQRTGSRWCIYPMYDFTHGLSDAIEGVTHSLCTLEFEDHRPLYDWFIDNVSAPSRPRQIEFSRLNLSYTVMSKRLLTRLVESGVVNGWDDPRMPTLSGLRRRGFTPASICNFIASVGITKKDNLIDMLVLENAIREDLDPVAPRAMAVLRPLRVVLCNYPEGESETLEIPNHPKDPTLGTRQVSISREIYIEQDDFMLDPPKKFFRLGPGREVRLRNAFVIRCDRMEQDDHGNVTALYCEYLPQTRNGVQPEGRRVKGIIHWVNAADAVDAEVRLYDRLFREATPRADADGGFANALNPDSLEVLRECKLEASLAAANGRTRYQFERLGYFRKDPDSTAESPVFNRIVTLRNSWDKIESSAN